MTYTPLQITKNLLKPWSPCSSGYKWFAAKFPQGAEFTAVQKALRQDQRFDDARWLTDKVWANIIMQTPAATADITNNSKTETLEIIAETTALKVETFSSEELADGASVTNDGGKYAARIGSSGDAAQIGSSGDDAQIGSSGYDARIGSSGYDARIGSSGYDARIGSSGDAARIGSSGYDARIGSSGYAARIGSSGDAARIGSSGDDAQIGSSGDAAQIGSSGYAARIGSSGDAAQIGSSGYDARIGSSGDAARIGATGKNAVIACAGQDSKALAGENGSIALAWFDATAKRTRIAVGYVGEDLKPDTWYQIEEGKFVEVPQ